MLLSKLMRAPWPALTLVLLFAPVTSLWASQGSGDRLELRDALARALASNPTLAIYPWQERADDARVLQAGLVPNPELTTEIDNLAGTGNYSGTSSTELTLALSQIIELGDKRAHRRHAAETQRALTRFDYELARLDVLAETAGRFVDVARAQALLEVARRASELAAATEKVAEQRVASGRSPKAELSQALIELARTEIDAEHAEHALATARIRLAASWGDTTARFGDVHANLTALPAVPPLDELLARLDRAPDIQRYLAIERVAAAQEALARANARQDLRIGVGVRRFQETSDQAFLLRFSIPLPLADRNQGQIAAARAEQRMTEAQRQQARVETHAVLFGLYQELIHARTESSALHTTVLPEARSMMEQVDSGYREGRFSYLELAAARRQLLEVEQAAIESSAQVHGLLLELERLTGHPMVAQVQQTLPETEQ